MNWMHRHLIDTGILDQQGVGRRAVWRRCPTCHARLLVGYDSHRAAGLAKVDPTPLDFNQELQAVTTGRTTYDLWVHPRFELERRDRWRLASPRRDWPVLPTHQCGIPLAPYITEVVAPTRPGPTPPASDEPPF